MMMDLDRKDLISLAKGTTPNYDVMDKKGIKENGSYNASCGSWSWNYLAFNNLTDEEIIEVYMTCKKSWE